MNQKVTPNNQANQTYIKNLAEGIIFSQGVDPTSNNLVALFATGEEKNNRQALIYWIRNLLNEIPVDPNKTLPSLIESFQDNIEEVITFNN